MSAVAEKAGLSRENLYRALGGEAKPEFGTVIKVLHALGIDLVAQPQGAGRHKESRSTLECGFGAERCSVLAVDDQRHSSLRRVGNAELDSRDRALPIAVTEVHEFLPSCATSSVRSSLANGVMCRAPQCGHSSSHMQDHSSVQIRAAALASVQRLRNQAMVELLRSQAIIAARDELDKSTVAEILKLLAYLRF